MRQILEVQEIDRPPSRLQRLFPVLLLALSVSSTEGNSIQVASSPAPENGYGLRVTLDDPTDAVPREVWVAVGPDEGIQEEIAVYGSFSVDPTNLATGDDGRAGRRPGGRVGRRQRVRGSPAQIHFIRLSRDLTPQGAYVTLFLEQGSGGHWLLGALVWNDSLSRYSEAGRAPLAETPSVGATPVTFEWGAASSPGTRDGYLRLFRTVEGEPTLLFERTDLDNGTQVLNYMQVGIVDVSRQFPGTYGDLYLDEIELNREPSP